MEEKIEISVEEYNELLRRSKKLLALENGGVDNWEWYDESMQEYWNSEED